jgi:hypothetical protein
MIRIEHHHGRSCPFLYCDVCGARILETGQAMAAWRFGESPVSIVHKGDCLNRFSKRFCPEGYTLATEELDVHLCQLANNHGVKAERPKRLECE